MKHISTIEAFIRTLINSDTFHALVVQSLPGWGKSTAIDLSLNKLGVRAVAVGAYATPLHIYNTLCRYPDSILVLDDCASLFSEPKTMAILKAATWQSGGEGAAQSRLKARRVNWGSTSDKVEQPATDFSGKFILLTNAVPSGTETEAFLSRCLSYRIRLEENDVRQMLLDAALSQAYFPKSALASEVAEFLVADTDSIDLMRISLRTLKMGYDFALTHPEGWRELFLEVLPKRKESLQQGARQPRAQNEEREILKLLHSNLNVNEQADRFAAITGKSRRTYFLYKKKLGLTRSYQSQTV